MFLLLECDACLLQDPKMIYLPVISLCISLAWLIWWRDLEALFRIIVLSHPVLSILMLLALADYEMPLTYIAEILLVHAVPEDCA